MNKNIYLTQDFIATDLRTELEWAKYAIIKDVLSFSEECKMYSLISTGIYITGVYFWNNEDGLWENVKNKDVPLFEEMATAGYTKIPNIYISNTLEITDDINSVYKIINSGEGRGFYKKIEGVWSRELTPEEITELCKINRRQKGKYYEQIIGRY